MSRIAWFSPISLQSGLRSAHFTHTLLSQAPQSWDVEIFVDAEDYTSLNASQYHLFGFPVYLYHQYFLRNRARRFETVVFQVEDRPETAFAKRMAAIHPGIVYVHDLNLARLELGVEDYSTNGVLLEERLKERFGEDVLPLGEYQARGWSFDVFDSKYAHVNLEYHPKSLLVAENERSVAELKNRGAANVALSATPIRAVQPGAVVEARKLYRQRLGFSADDKIVGFCGRYVTEDRVGIALEAFVELSSQNAELGNSLKFFWMVSDCETEKRAQSIIERYQGIGLNAEQVKLLLLDERLTLSAALCIPDIMLALKFDALRGIPLPALLAMARGVPTVMSFFGPSAEVSNGAVAQVPVGLGEKTQVRECLRRLFTESEFYHALSEAGREYTESLSDPAAVMEDLRVLLQQEGRELRDAQKQYESQLSQAREVCLAQSEQRLQKRVGGISWSSAFSAFNREGEGALFS